VQRFGTRRKSLRLGEPAEAVRAAEQVREITAEGGTRAVELVVALLNSAPDDQAVSAVGAAGPREDLLAEHWDDVIDEIEALALAGRPIHRALTSVYLVGDREARLRPWMR
jgi:hypothetical protein